jgi:hypothetical protein
MAVVCGPEARAPGERGWRSRAGRRPARLGSADGGRVRAGGWCTQGARMAVACGSEAGAPGEQELFSETTLQGRASKHAVHSMISVCDQHHLCVSGTKT